MKKDGLLLHQHNFSEDLLKGHVAHLKRTTPKDPEHTQKVPPPPPDPSNPEHQEWIKIVLWLSTRTRPDLAYAVLGTAQVLTKDLELLKIKLRHSQRYQDRRDCFTCIKDAGRRNSRSSPSLEIRHVTHQENIPIKVYHSPVLWKCQTLTSLAIANPQENQR